MTSSGIGRRFGVSLLIVYDSNFFDLAQNISNIDKNIADRVKAAVYEHLKDLVVRENNENPIPSLPSPENLLHKSVNSPPPTADKTSAKGSGAKNSLAEQVAKANAKGLGAKLNSKDEVAKATEVKKNLAEDFGNDGLVYVDVSLAKDPARQLLYRLIKFV